MHTHTCTHNTHTPYFLTGPPPSLHLPALEYLNEDIVASEHAHRCKAKLVCKYITLECLSKVFSESVKYTWCEPLKYHREHSIIIHTSYHLILASGICIPTY